MKMDVAANIQCSSWFDYHLSSDKTVEGLLRDETNGMDGEKTAHLCKESELAELPKWHVESGCQWKFDDLTNIFFKLKFNRYYPLKFVLYVFMYLSNTASVQKS